MAWRVSDRTNFWLHVTEGALCTLGMGVFGQGSVLPLLVRRLSGGAVAIGSLGTITSVTSVLQVVAARFVEPMRRKKPWVMVTGLGMRLPYVAVPMVLVLAGASAPVVVLWVLLGTWLLSSVSGSLLMPGWLEMVRTTIPGGRRGRLFGYRHFLSSLMGLGAGVLVRELLAVLSFPSSFAAVGAVSGVAVMASWVVYGFVNDAPAPTIREVQPWSEYVQELVRLLRPSTGSGRGEPVEARQQSALRPYLLYVALTSGVTATFVFLPTALTTPIGLGDEVVGIYIAVAAAARVVASPVSGWLVDRFGPRRMLPVGAVFLSASMLTALSAEGVVGGAGAYVLMSAGMSLEMICRPATIMELAYGERRVGQLVLPSLVAWPVRTVGPLVAALVVRWAGYPTLFGLAACVGLLAAWTGTSLARSPKITP